MSENSELVKECALRRVKAGDRITVNLTPDSCRVLNDALSRMEAAFPQANVTDSGLVNMCLCMQGGK